MASRLTRALALAAVPALALSGTLLGPAAPAVADDRAVDPGSAWLNGELTNGLIRNDQFNFDDIGLTIDTALALDAVDAPQAQLDAIETALAGKVDGYTQFGASKYAGASAKALVAAQLFEVDPQTWGGAGVDLIQRTQDRVLDQAPVTGRIADEDEFGDYANVVGQSFAARGLSDAGSADAAAVTTFLLEQQCDAGYFRLDFTKDKTAAEQGCVDGADGSGPDVDATALTVLNLLEIDSPSPAVTGAVDDAIGWLTQVQAADGGFSGVGTGAPNSNSTGLAAWAFAEHGSDSLATKAGAWVRARQSAARAGCRDDMDAEAGAIALDDAALTAGRRDGIPVALQDQWRRTSAQALPALEHAPEATGTRAVVAGSAGRYVRAGSKQNLSATGIAVGDTACGATAVSGAETAADSTGRARLGVTLPSKWGNHVVTVTDAVGTVGSVTFKALAAKKLRVALEKRPVARGRKQVATVRGLARGEQFKITYRGRVLKRGVVGATGKATVRFNVGRRLGMTKVRVVGQFSNRKGESAFRVVRRR